MESYDEWQAREKRIDEMTRQAAMIIKDNPMIPADAEPNWMRNRMERNRGLLRVDRDARMGPHGNVYNGIMSTRYNG